MEKSLKKVLETYGFNFKKAYGQNFLTDLSLLNEIVTNARVTKEDTVLEIGCGAGALTKVLSEHAKRVIGYEIDEKLKPVLAQTLSDCNNVSLVFADIMKEKLPELEKKLGDGYKLVANLPYYITTPIIMNFLENGKHLKSMSVMVQKEVAERLIANAGDSEYGAITVGINLRGKAEIIAEVPRNMFTPQPNVDSAVVKIDIEKDKFKDVDYKKVRDVVRVAFSSRRKMLINNLMNGFKLTRAKAEDFLKTADIPLTVRGEDLTAEEYVKLVKVM